MILRTVIRGISKLTVQPIYGYSRRPRSGKPYKLSTVQKYYFERLAFP